MPSQFILSLSDIRLVLKECGRKLRENYWKLAIIVSCFPIDQQEREKAEVYFRDRRLCWEGKRVVRNLNKLNVVLLVNNLFFLHSSELAEFFYLFKRNDILDKSLTSFPYFHPFASFLLVISERIRSARNEFADTRSIFSAFDYISGSFFLVNFPDKKDFSFE